MRDDFAVFILSHGRPDKIFTLDMIEKAGYSGKWYIVIDDEDSTAEQYYRRYGDRVVQFCKEEVANKIDVADNFGIRNSVVYARNACFDIAEKMGLKYFLELDDDYQAIYYRYVKFGKLKAIPVTNLDEVINAMLDFLEVSGAYSVCFAQGGDFIGGASTGMFVKGLGRKAMNTFFCSTERRFQFVGNLNEDVCTYTWLGSRGYLFFTVPTIQIIPAGTQSVKGGITEVYRKVGTYIKTFYAILFMPSAVKVSVMGMSKKRVHHKVLWDNCVPQILHERWKVGR